jgi:hypothetical protein
LTLFEVEGGAINEIPHFVVLWFCSCIFGVTPLMHKLRAVL